MRPPGSPIVLALDTPDLDEARAWAAAAGSAIGLVKVGLELFGAHGPAAVRALRADGHRVMLDLKLHDIPATVGRAVAALDPLGAELLTVHAAGGGAMLEAALAAASGASRITAVTVLTSLDGDDLAAIGLGQPDAATERLARLALDAGCRALVCSPLEVARARALAGPDVILVCPGVRPVDAGGSRGAAERRAGRAAGPAGPAAAEPSAGAAGPGAVPASPGVDDQARVATPGEALAAGADLLVVGRPITRAADPAAAAGAISAEALAGRGGAR
jgi:orotidine-5'-phosphate decarboxylase